MANYWIEHQTPKYTLVASTIQHGHILIKRKEGISLLLDDSDMENFRALVGKIEAGDALIYGFDDLAAEYDHCMKYSPLEFLVERYGLDWK